MKNIILLGILLISLLVCLVWIRTIVISNELLDLNSKIDKIVIFLDLDLNAEKEGGE